MDFWIDIGFAVLLRLLREKRGLSKYRAAFLKLAQAILAAFGDDAEFAAMVQPTKKGRG